MYVFLPLFIHSKFICWTASEKSSQVTPGAGHQGCRAEPDLPAPALEKHPEIEGRIVARPFCCEWNLRWGWVGRAKSLGTDAETCLTDNDRAAGHLEPTPTAVGSRNT